jgi:hypothetical protein
VGRVPAGLAEQASHRGGVGGGVTSRLALLLSPPLSPSPSRARCRAL